MSTREFLAPDRKLVEEVADWLLGERGYAGRVRYEAGNVPSLAHVLLIVPTAQSGRNLRLVLAKKAVAKGWGGILPPKVQMPDLLLQPKGKRVATEAEELAVLADILDHTDVTGFAALFPRPPEKKSLDWSLDAAWTILGIYPVLGEKGLLMREVVAEEDAERWKDLARLEEQFLGFFAAKDIVPRCQARRLAAQAGCVEPNIAEIVLPAALDIQGVFADYLTHSGCPVTLLIQADPKYDAQFDEWGHPLAGFAAKLSPRAVKSAPTPVAEADAIASYFAAIPKTEALPALVVCDAALHPALEGAFQNKFGEDELVLRNPSRESLAHSALGRLLIELMQLAERGDYETFSAFIRSGDVARWAAAALGRSTAEIAAAVGSLDKVQNSHLPRSIDEVIKGIAEVIKDAEAEDEETRAHTKKEHEDYGCLLQLTQKIKKELPTRINFLEKIFSSLVLDEKNPSDRELVAAAEAVRDLRKMCASELIPEHLRTPLFLRLIKNASYMQEPTAANVLVANGWLEAAWCPEEEIVFAGFNEGCVPGDVVGHAFIPDSLRQSLGLTTNASRTLRDKCIFAQVLRCRPEGAVTCYLHQLGADTSVTKPSRLIFPCVTDAQLPALAQRLYAVSQGSTNRPAKSLPKAWRLALPFPPKGMNYREKISALSIDSYLRCPFKFYLKELFGEPVDDQYRELDVRDFGKLCHTALESFAKSSLKDSMDAEEIAAFLRGEVKRILGPFGDPLPTIIELQGEAAIARLEAFAQRQVKWRAEGWRIMYAEQKLSCTLKECPTRINGRFDRIDKNEKTGQLAIIDYKTWPRITEERRKSSLQLPIYRAMLEPSGLFPREVAHDSIALYCILGERKEDTYFDEEFAYHAGGQGEAEAEIVDILRRIAFGIFYPPNGNDWSTDNDKAYGSLIWQTPEEGLDPAWLADQKQRMEAYEVWKESHPLQ